ncbi:unnamed protein product [Hydatigera taeniaeformis]|uniref:DUF2110 family protein n=1 Tax=Hydatigena taeniaeformis TaxID=6205 RepID=A0A0R3X7G8_HYDTA|nr:unnamed protein product [Hydatigera taeniaeformis]
MMSLPYCHSCLPLETNHKGCRALRSLHSDEVSALQVVGPKEEMVDLHGEVVGIRWEVVSPTLDVVNRSGEAVATIGEVLDLQKAVADPSQDLVGTSVVVVDLHREDTGQDWEVACVL